MAEPPATAGTAPTYPMLIWVLGLMAAFGPLSIDTYLPAMPQMAAEFAASPGDVQLTLGMFFVGFAVGQLFHGPMSDRLGRRPVLLTGIVIYIVTSALCALASQIEHLIALRFLQALGGGAGGVIARAIVRDTFPTDQASRALSLMMLVMSVAPLLSPLLGGYLAVWFGWRSIFWCLAGFGIVALLAASWRIPETLPPDKRRRAGVAQMLRGYLEVFRHRRSIGYILTGAAGYAGMFAFFSGSPFVYIEVYGVPAEHYGLLFALNVVGLIACATANSRLVTRVGSRRMLSIGTAIVFVAGLALLATGLTGFGGLVGIVVPLFFFIGSLNLIGANAVALTLSHFPHVAGTAAASFGITQFTMGAVVGAIVGQLHDGTALPMCATIAGCGIVSFTARHLIAARAPEGPVVD